VELAQALALAGLLCKLERHDFDHATIDGDDIVLRCFLLLARASLHSRRKGQTR